MSKEALFREMQARANRRAEELGFLPGTRVCWNGRRTGKVAKEWANAHFAHDPNPRIYCDMDAGPGNAQAAQLMLRASELEILER